MSSIQTLSPGGEPQFGRPRFSSPVMAVFVVAHEGMHPMNLLPPPMVAEVTLEGKGFSRGRCPVSRFPWMENCVKLLMSSTHNGNSPDSWLPRRCSCKRLGSCRSSDGIDPLRLLLLSVRYWRLARFLSSDGIDPLRLLLLICSDWRLVRFPSSGGSVPFSGGVVALRKKSAMTR